MRCRKTNRNQQVQRLVSFRRNCPVRNLIWLDGNFDVSLVLHASIRHGYALGVVRVAVIRSHPNGVCLCSLRLQVRLAHHVFPQHPAAFADIELIGPVIRIGILVPGQTPLVYLRAQTRRHGIIVGDKVKQGLGVMKMLLPERGLSSVGCLWIVPAMADVVRRERPKVVEVRLVIRDRYDKEDVVHARRASAMLMELIEIPLEQSKARPVVTLWSWKRQTVSWIGGENEAKVIGLNLFIARTWRSQRAGVDLRQQAMMLVVS